MKTKFLLLLAFILTSSFYAFSQNIRSYAQLRGWYLAVENCKGMSARMEYSKSYKFIGLGIALGYHTSLPFTNHSGVIINRGQYFPPIDNIRGMTEAFLGLHLTADIIRMCTSHDVPHSIKAGFTGGYSNVSEVYKTEDFMKYLTHFREYFSYDFSYEYTLFKSYAIGCFYERRLVFNDADVYGISVKHIF